MTSVILKLISNIITNKVIDVSVINNEGDNFLHLLVFDKNH